MDWTWGCGEECQFENETLKVGDGGVDGKERCWKKVEHVCVGATVDGSVADVDDDEDAPRAHD